MIKSVDRILGTGENKEHTDYGKVYYPKDTHGPFRKKLILLQNRYWIDMPLTILGILGLFFIPMF